MTKETPKNGLHAQYYDNGQKRSECNFQDGKRYGKSTNWYKNGQIVSEANYKENKCIGGT